jgi:hypothetical protein
MRLSEDQHRRIAEAFEEAATHPVLPAEIRAGYLYKARLARLLAKLAAQRGAAAVSLDERAVASAEGI